MPETHEQELTGEWLLWDIETDGFIDQLTRVHCVAVIDLRNDDAEPVLYPPDRVEEGLRRIMAAEYNAGHNILSFDIPAVQKVYPWFRPLGKVTDTLIVSKLVWPHIKDLDFSRAERDPSFPKKMIGRHGLEAWGHRFGLHKGDYSAIMKARGLDPWAEYSDEMGSYCAQDVRVNKRLWQQQLAAKPPRNAVRLEQELVEIIDRQTARGIRFDTTAAYKLTAELSARRSVLHEHLAALVRPWWVGKKQTRAAKSRRVGLPHFGKRRITPIGKNGKPLKPKEVFNVYATVHEGSVATPVVLTDFNPSSRDHVADRMIKLYGWQPTEFTDSGKPKVDDETLGSLPDNVPIAQPLREYYMLLKRLGQIAEGNEAWLRHCSDAGRIHGRLDTIGTQTSRATHYQPNLGQVPSITNADGTVPYGRECRSLFVPDPGYTLLGVDCSGLELRCLAHYLWLWDEGAYADVVLNGDVHWTNAQALGLVPKGTVRDKHNKQHEDARAVAKRFI